LAVFGLPFFILRFLKIIVLILIGVSAKAQLPEQELPEIEISDSLQVRKEPVLALKRPVILEIQPEDVGQLLQKMAGINVKSYGGLGGLKTISVRSLGSQHTSIVVDGFNLINTQTGQINLGNIQIDNIENMYVIIGAQKNILLPASAQVSGSALFIETFENTFNSEKHQVRCASKVGSFGQFDNYLSYKLNLRKVRFSVFGKYRFADGVYPYSFQNGQSTYSGIRENNRYRDAYGGFSFGLRVKKGILNINYRTEGSDQQLPGAVILYSNNSFQTLSSLNHRIQTSYILSLEKATLRTFLAGNTGNLEYRDTTFLNSSGEIHSIYQNESIQTGLNLRYSPNIKMNFFTGTEEQISRLKTNIEGFGIPVRYHNFSVIGIKFNSKIAYLTAQISTQYIIDQNDSVQRDNVFRANPFIQLESREYIKKLYLKLNVFYRNSFRMPGFNELYYNNIGNSKLKPEDANQVSGGFTINPKRNRLLIMNRSNFYFNQVNNKIVAVPTKNLFIWSMQNIGKVNILGAETTFDLFYKLNDKWNLASNLNYTFQQTIDITDKNSPTYGHQIAYIPKHTFNADLSLKYKKIGIRWSTFGNSLRYALNENIPSNEIDGFVLSDLSIFGVYAFKKQDFRLQFTCKNIFNSSYSIVRYYVMPGRNFLISLNYALN